MKKVKLCTVLDIKRGTSLSGEYYATTGKYIRLTLGNFKYPDSGWKNNTSKDDIYFIGPVRKEFILKQGDIITPLTEQVRGLLGNTATIPESDRYIQSGDIGLVIPNENELDKRYAYYLLSSGVVKKQLDAGSQQTKIRHTSPDAIKNCYAYVLEKPEQIKVAKMLDDINSKIEVNNRINDNLQQLMRLLYNEFFIQYRIDGNYISDLVFNDKLNRYIPRKWEVHALDKLILEITTGLNPRDNFTLTSSGYKYITVKNLDSNGALNFNGCDCVDENAKEQIQKRAKVSKGDILFASITPLGRCFAVLDNPKDWVINESVFCVKPKDISLQAYLYLFLTSDYFVKKAENSSAGSIFSGIRISTLNSIYTIVPSKETINSFNEKVIPILRKIDFINQENNKLISMRDELLPLLMNGQISIS